MTTELQKLCVERPMLPGQMLSALQDFLARIEAVRTLKTFISELRKHQRVGFPGNLLGCSPCCLSLGTVSIIYTEHIQSPGWFAEIKCSLGVSVSLSARTTTKKCCYYLTHRRKKSECGWGWQTSLEVKMLPLSSIFLLLPTHPFFPGVTLFCSSLHSLEHLLQKMELNLTIPTWENRS